MSWDFGQSDVCLFLAMVLPVLSTIASRFRTQIRPTPPHLTSAMAENILAAACESETRNAAKRMRLDAYQPAVNTLPAAAPRTTRNSSKPMMDNRPKVHSSRLFVLVC